MRLAFALIGLRIARGHAAQGNQVGAVLVSSRGRILSWGVNTNASNSTRHAEMNCVQAFQHRHGGVAIPAGSFLFTTLQSCEMCSGALVTAAPGGILVVYAETDPGILRSALRETARFHCTEVRSTDAHFHPIAHSRWSRAVRAIVQLNRMQPVQVNQRIIHDLKPVATKHFRDAHAAAAQAARAAQLGRPLTGAEVGAVRKASGELVGPQINQMYLRLNQAIHAYSAGRGLTAALDHHATMQALVRELRLFDAQHFEAILNFATPESGDLAAWVQCFALLRLLGYDS
jgi:tRNA(Arg) A34 adenosine deaminase TadA